MSNVRVSTNLVQDNYRLIICKVSPFVFKAFSVITFPFFDKRIFDMTNASIIFAYFYYFTMNP